MGGGPSSATQGGPLSSNFFRTLSSECKLDIRNARCCLGLRAQLVPGLAGGVVPGWSFPAETTCIPGTHCCGQKTIQVGNVWLQVREGLSLPSNVHSFLFGRGGVGWGCPSASP